MGNLAKRVLTASILAPIVAALFYFLPHFWFFLFLCLVSLAALYEAITIAEVKGRYFFLLLCLLGFLPLYWRLFPLYLVWLIASPLFYLLMRLLRGGGREEGINEEVMRSTSTMFLGEILIVLPLFSIYLMQELNAFLPLILLLILWASDTGAYFLGRFFGKKPLAPMISPKKTYEGLLGAVLGSTIILFSLRTPLGFGVAQSLIIGAAMGLLGQLGDLLESITKRVTRIKDSSSLIPGHGGILDRIDSFTFAAPFLYLCALWKV